MRGQRSAAPADQKPLLRNPWFLAVVFGLVAVPVMRFVIPWRRVPKPPKVVKQLPDYRLVDQNGKPFGSQELRGKVYVASFFFTTCLTICPKIGKAMAALQKRYANNNVPIHLVSFSVDPENDREAELRAFGKKYGADFKRWTFLTGPAKNPRAPVVTLIEQGFMTHVGKKVRKGNLVDIAHTQRLAIVDQKGRLRGFYGSDESGIDEVFHRSQHVLNEGR